VSYRFALTEQFARGEIARGLSGRIVVNELVREGHCDPEKARDLVSQMGPEVYRTLNRRYGLVCIIGLFSLIAAFYAVAVPNSLLWQFQPSLLWTMAIGGSVLAVVGYVRARRFRAWTSILDEADGVEVRLDGFAREQLMRGKGTWSIVHDLVRMGHVDTAAARAIVERIRPELEGQLPRPGRNRFLFGLLVLAIPASLFGTILFGRIFLSEGMRGGPTYPEAFLMLLYPPMMLFEVVGLILILQGWSRMRRFKDSITPDNPSGPASTGLWWRADPFEWK
jgi:hypothetical protein